MEINKKFDFDSLFKGKNLAIIILSTLLLLCFVIIGNVDTTEKDTEIEKLNSSLTELQQQMQIMEKEKIELKTQNENLKKEVEELKTSKVVETTESTSQPTSETTSANVEVAETTPATSTTTTPVERDYIINKNTKVFHYPSCSSVSKMKDSNKKEYSGTSDELINQGYKPCQICNP